MNSTDITIKSELKAKPKEDEHYLQYKSMETGGNFTLIATSIQYHLKQGRWCTLEVMWGCFIVWKLGMKKIW